MFDLWGKLFPKGTFKERHNYEDPVTDFLTCLYVKYDFDEAQKKLRQCEEVLSNDFFLTACLEDFRESARLLIFEMFCRIHQCISLEMLAERLNMQQVEAERWIVDLIRNYRIEGAKIDSKLGQVVMGATSSSTHEQVMENSKRLTFRSQQTALQLEKVKLDKKVVMGATSSSTHEQVMENSKRLTFRSQQTALQLEKVKLDKKGTWKADLA
ncbi:Eukaryotic translation initiation factor 3 subunit E [Toxocara canis]|uniref:Eukaryotic translation initiation factor 3 subunit E n=1 Tax=Toxocara canis TaxID=6265 RepID=A0A0B2V0R9_TOXCA|nr:Eukaryotic translation initiation factor 3 subunit E [Toxocara canis]